MVTSYVELLLMVKGHTRFRFVASVRNAKSKAQDESQQAAKREACFRTDRFFRFPESDRS